LSIRGGCGKWCGKSRAFRGLTPLEKTALAGWLRRFRASDGVFAIPEMREGEVFKKPDREETWRYIRFHLTNYALGALQALDAHDDLNLAFVALFLDPQYLEAWLSRRDMRDPWQEGNNIVNLGSFLLLLRERGSHVMERAMGKQDSLARTVHSPAAALGSKARLHSFQRTLHGK
jgi:hypothetical protein